MYIAISFCFIFRNFNKLFSIAFYEIIYIQRHHKLATRINWNKLTKKNVSSTFYYFRRRRRPTVNQRWHLWIERFENFLIVSSVSGAKKKKAMLLHYAGESVFEMYKQMESYDPNDNYDDVKRKLNEHFEINKNADVLRMNFRRAVQFEEESLDEFHSRLKKLAKHCTFENLTSEIREQIIQNCYSSRLRRKILEMKV